MLLDTLALARNACLLAARVPLPTLLAWPQADTNKLEHSIQKFSKPPSLKLHRRLVIDSGVIVQTYDETSLLKCLGC